MPALLLLIAREIHLHDPMRVLAWRALHEDITWPAWIAPLLPAPSGAVDRDPVALLLTSLAILVAIVYAAAAPWMRLRWRATLLGAGTAVLVLLPTLGLVSMGFATGRPYGQDGGVVQLPLAMDRLLSGRSPYGADYSDSMLGKQARVSSFWRDYGGNPILRHHAYLPGTHLLMLPPYLASRAVLGVFDTRFVTLAAFVLTALLAYRFVRGGTRGLVAAAVVLVNPLVWWHQVFGANDVLVAGLLLGSARAADRERRGWAGALLGLACATKQLAWPYAPFLVVRLMGASTFRDLGRRETWAHAARPLLAAAAVFVAVVVPVWALDPGAFWGDIVAYNVGLAGGDAYPLGGTPGFGFANLLIYAGAVGSLKDHASFAGFYLLLVPLGLLMLRRQMRERSAAVALVLGSVALTASLYFSRVVHPNYLVLAAILLPIGCLARGRDALLALAPLSLLALAVEYAQNEMLRASWEQAVAYGAAGFLGAFAPRAGPHLTVDPLGALVSALIAGVAVAWLLTSAIVDRPRVQAALLALGVTCAVVLPTALFVAVGAATAPSGGPMRGQDPWLGDVAYTDGVPLVDESHPARVREAWSSSFRQEPPAALTPTAEVMPVARVLAYGLTAVGLRDPRPVLLVALLVAGALAVLAHPSRWPLALAVTLIAPALASGLALGAPDALVLAALLAAFALLKRGRPLPAGFAGGLAGMTQLQAMASPGVLIRARLGERRFWMLVLAAWTATVVVGLAILKGPRPTPALPTLGIGGLLAYWGAESSAIATTARVWLSGLALVFVLYAPAERSRSWTMAVAMLIGLFFWGVSASWVAAPIGLLALGALEEVGVSAAAA